uniref:Uncharacterized protein n=1 Tax=Anguilla anguilla TaxID=7936 RepID=A0A0E9XUB7_ANGAN
MTDRQTCDTLPWTVMNSKLSKSCLDNFHIYAH